MQPNVLVQKKKSAWITWQNSVILSYVIFQSLFSYDLCLPLSFKVTKVMKNLYFQQEFIHPLTNMLKHYSLPN
jgi:hypothetical protein